MSELRLWELSKRYGRGPFVLEGLTASFKSGEGVGLVGPNGSGKSTLLRLLTVTAFPTSGEVLLDGENIHERPHALLGRIGIVPEEPALPAYLTAVEVLEYVLRARGRWEASSAGLIERTLDRLMLDSRRGNLVGTFSSGMLAKLQIAAALLPAPDILLMDEPFRGLDETSTHAATELLQAFREAGGLLIIASHLRTTLGAVCDRVIQFPLDGQL